MNDVTTHEIDERERESEREGEDRGHLTDSYRLSSLLTQFLVPLQM